MEYDPLLEKMLAITPGLDCDELINFVESNRDISINSNGSLVERQAEGDENRVRVEDGEVEEEAAREVKETSKKRPTDPRDRTRNYLENIKYRRTTISKKWGTEEKPGTLQKNAELFSRQTGLHVQIIVFDPIQKKKRVFKSSNMKQKDYEQPCEQQQESQQQTT